MGTVHFLRQSDRHQASMEALFKHEEMMEEIREVHLQVDKLLAAAETLMDDDLRAICTDPNYKFDNGVREALELIKAERVALTARGDALLARADAYLKWYDETFKR